MDFQGLAEQNHNIIAATFLRKKKLLHARVNGILSFFQKITSGLKIFLLQLVNLQKNSFTCKWSDNYWNSKIAEKTCSSISALVILVINQ